jgi:exosome complex component RRP42
MAGSISRSEAAYQVTSLLSNIRADGRTRLDYRDIVLATGVAPQANGSSRLALGGSDILVGCRLETVDLEPGESRGRVECVVQWSAQPVFFLDFFFLLNFLTAFSSSAAALSSLDNKDPSTPLSDFLTSLLSPLASHPQLIVVPYKKAWSLEVDVEILCADGGSVLDAAVLAVRAALWDLRIPRTKSVGNLLPKESGATEEDVVVESLGGEAVGGHGMETLLRAGGAGGTGKAKAVDFELENYWDDGVPLEGRESQPVAVTLNLVRISFSIEKKKN